MSHDVVETLCRAKQAYEEECKRKSAEFDLLIEQAKRITAGLPLTPLNPTEGLRSLDGLPVREAIRECLAWAEERGRESMTMGELEESLLKFRVLTSQRKPLNENENPWKVICNTVMAGPNQEFFEVEKRGLHLQRNDIIKPVHKMAKKA